MQRKLFVCLAFLALWAGLVSQAGAEETLQFGRFGKVTLYHKIPHPAHVVLFVSGDGGWNLGVIDMARSLANLDALVVGIDINHYLRELAKGQEKCSYPAADFEELSKFVQKSLGFSRYIMPVLVGYSSGATLVYATVVQSPPNTFRAAISLGFSPDLPVSKPFCRGSGLRAEPGPKGKGFNFLPAPDLATPWVVLQGEIDKVCDAKAAEAFARQVGHSEYVLLPGVGHGFSVQKHWLPQFRKAFSQLVRTVASVAESPNKNSLADLPLVEVAPVDNSGDTLALIISGDGGWASLDREVGDELARRGIAVVGLNSLQYFWTARQPDGMARDLARILDYYLAAWHKERVLLIGYSLGADVLPFMVSRLPVELLDKVTKLVMLGPSQQTSFEFHLSDWLGTSSHKSDRPLRPEVEKIRGPQILCLYGQAEEDSLCRDNMPADLKWKAITMPGGHHFDGNYKALADIILHP